MSLLKLLGKLAGILFGSLVTYLILIIFGPGFRVEEHPLQEKEERAGKDRVPVRPREDVSFQVNGTNISGWLFLPEDAYTAAPCVVMNHGFGGTKDFLLDRYIPQFVDAGLAVLTYDYRHFGTSEGQPRQVFDVSYQLEDLRAAIAYARERTEIDPEQIVLWGTSSSGGYGLVVAAEDPRIKAVIGQCAGLDHQADGKMYLDRVGMGYFLRLIMHAQRDKGRSRFGLSPHYIPLVGEPGTLAMHNAPGALDGYDRITQGSETFQNAVCARLLLMAHGPDVNEVAHDVRCPVLLLVCAEDNLVAPDSHVKVAAALGERVVVHSFPVGHFDIYEEPYLEKAIEKKLAFLREHLQLPAYAPIAA